MKKQFKIAKQGRSKKKKFLFNLISLLAKILGKTLLYLHKCLTHFSLSQSALHKVLTANFFPELSSCNKKHKI